MVSTVDTVIVGAGIGGLTAAEALQRSGQKVLVLEATNRPGGRIVKITRKNGDAAEAGAQGIHSNYTEMLGMLDRFGMKGDLRPSFGKVQYLDHSGAPRISGGNSDLAKIVGTRGKLDLAYFWARYFTFAKKFPQFEAVRDIPQYDNVSAAEELRWAGRNFTDFVLRPMSWAMANSTPDKIGMYYIVNGLRIRMTTKIMSLLHGNESLMAKLASTVPVQYGAPVKTVLTTNGVVDGVELEDGTAIKANHVILSCTAAIAGQLLTEEFGQVKRFLTNYTHTPLSLVFFFLDRPLGKEAYSFMGHPFRDAMFNMALDHSKKTPFLAPSGKAIVSAWPAFPRSVDLMKRTDAEIIEQARTDLEGFFPGFSSWIEEARVVRHHRAAARYEPGMYRKVLDFKKEAETFRGISFAGTDYDSIHMESGVRSGQRAAARALRGA
ncbi:FAD-binding protein [Mesorhizobium sp. M3A.F.Ca.ET.174.01.1.1]|nr:FAD-binding protein [Mesorhizobium sp. M3A.F.Ca.ET.175.01.1.1]TGT27901.1 FAD-binding protein [Mesorhizobium sp. M3A.F.Ca.ET.174.01.1.1]